MAKNPVQDYNEDGYILANIDVSEKGSNVQYRSYPPQSAGTHYIVTGLARYLTVTETFKQEFTKPNTLNLPLYVPHPKQSYSLLGKLPIVDVTDAIGSSYSEYEDAGFGSWITMKRSLVHVKGLYFVATIQISSFSDMVFDTSTFIRRLVT
jgi:hypothetical protein